MIKVGLLLFSFLGAGFISCKTTRLKADDCMGKAEEKMCTMDYRPVCGCDEKTYSNACMASAAGVKHWVEGECNSTNK